ncbi:hypothetical protein GA0115252_15117 [Streptomyces sp. DfronAA-171]|nr:hypothetical protein GA0115252_15117 [Streptomyces sp. DfronAA-171]
MTSGVRRHRVRRDAAAQPEDVLDDRLRDDLGGRALRDDPAGLHRDDVIGVPARLIEVVQDHHDRAALTPVEVRDEVEDVDLVGEVEVRRGLVKEQHGGALRDRHRDPRALPLAPRQLVHGAVGQLREPGRGERRVDRLLVRLRPLPPPRLVRGAAPAHEVPDRQALGRHGGLRQDAELAGEFPRGHRVQCRAVEFDDALAGGEETGEGAQERGLAAGVGAHDGRHPAGRHGEVEVGDDRAAVVGEVQAPGAQLGSLRLGERHGFSLQSPRG